MKKKDDRKRWNSTMRPGKGFKRNREKKTPVLKVRRRKVTGELQLFIQLYHERGGVSELSGQPLLPPGHPRFHCQGSHLLPKGMYPEYRLDPRNISMVLPKEHDQWTHVKDPDRLFALNPWWINIVRRYHALRLEANTKRHGAVRDQGRAGEHHQQPADHPDPDQGSEGTGDPGGALPAMPA